jgi:serine/threonine-protein kinase
MRYQNIKEMMIDMLRIQKDVNAEITNNNVEDEFTRVMNPVITKVPEAKKEINDEKVDEGKGISKKTKGILLFSLCMVLVIVLGALVAGGVSKINKPSTSKTNTIIKVPDVTGKTQSEAQKAIEAAGLKYETLDSIPSEVPKDSIIETVPSVGTDVKPSSVVKVRISSGLETYKIIDLKDYPIDNAKNTLIKSGFKAENITVIDEPNETVAATTVIRQNPAANQMGDKNTKIQLWVSKGPQFAKVPDLIGKTALEAESIVKSNNLTLEKKIETTNIKENDGKVMTQSIPKDTDTKVGQLLSVTIGKYEAKKITLPEFKTMTGTEYKTALMGLSSKLNVAIAIEANAPNKVKSITVNSKSLSAGDTIDENSSVIIITEADVKVSPTPSITPTPTPIVPGR